MDEMIKRKCGGLVVEIPRVMIVDGEELDFSPSDLVPVYDENADPYEDDPIGYNLVHEVPSHGTVNNGITFDMYGGVTVSPGPLDEQEEYEHPDDRPFDTYFEPPSDFVEQVNLYFEDDDISDDEDDDEEQDD